jgi:hypothetical protein
MKQSPRFSSTQFRPALQFFAPGEILAPEQTLSFLRRKVATFRRKNEVFGLGSAL